MQVIFRLAGPICGCHDQNLRPFMASNPYCLLVRCRTCEAEVKILWKTASTVIALNTPYPADVPVAVDPTGPDLSILEGPDEDDED